MRILVGFLLVVILLSSCEYEPIDAGLAPDLNDPVNLNAIFTADIDGVFNDFSSSVEAVETEDGIIIGTDIGPTLAIQIFNPSVGSFNVDPNNTNTGALIVYSDNSNNVYVPASGTVLVSTYNTFTNVIEGRFNGIMTELTGSAPDIVITNGVFEDIQYITGVTLDECSATVDGVDFTANVFASVEVNNQLGITFSNSLNEQINLSFPVNVTPGTYDIEAPGGTYTASYTDSNGVTYQAIANSGDIIITDVNNNVYVGLFNFTAQEVGNPSNSIIVTSGRFAYNN